MLRPCEGTELNRFETRTIRLKLVYKNPVFVRSSDLLLNKKIELATLLQK